MIAYLDIDGVLNRDPNGLGPAIDRTLTQRLVTLLPDIRWLTMRGQLANLIGFIYGIAQCPIAGTHELYPFGSWLARDASWWKLQTMRKLVTDEHEPFVWIDDHLRLVPDAHQWAAGLRTPNLLIAPDPRTGLSGAELDRIATFVALDTPSLVSD